jgi:dihydroxy-acid dehydratase
MAPTASEGQPLRSQDWFGGTGRDAFIHRSWMKRGLPDDVFDGTRPIIGICNTASELTPCNAHLGQVSEHVKRGVWEAGGVPVEFPVMSLGETLIRPTAMLLRNLMAMTVEESIRANPVDGVVLLSGCDKTTAAVLMGAASVDLPTIVVSGGPMLSGRYLGRQIGSGTDVWRFSEEVRAGRMTPEEFVAAESCMTRSAGHCNTMGTASTLACLVEAMGLSLPDGASIPASDTRRNRLAHLSGRRIVAMVAEDLRFSSIVTRGAMRNANVVNAAIGGSTNAVIHLLALAGRLGVDLTLDDIDADGRGVPLLVNLMPSGTHLMEDFFYAGGLPAVLEQVRHLLDPKAITVTGDTLVDSCEGARSTDPDIIASFDAPLRPDGAIAVLRGNLAPDGAVIKPAAADPRLLQHTGRAVVFSSIEDFKARVDDPDLDVDADSVLVLQGCGPRGYPGMPEVGNLPLPAKLLAQGVTDMVRISDARMSGTAYGAVVLHVAPEAHAGGPLAVVRTGDLITLDVAARRLTLQVTDEELEARLAAWSPPEREHERGWYRLYVDTVNQANLGADLDFLRGSSGHRVMRGSH